MPFSILIVDDEKQLCKIYAKKLHSENYKTYEANDGETAIQLVKQESIDLVILDYMLPDTTGIDVLEIIKKHNPSINVVMLTAYGNIENAVRAMKIGAYDFINKPVKLDHLVTIVKKLDNEKSASSPQSKKGSKNIKRNDIVFESNKMKQIIKFLEKIMDTDVSILVLGETGSGKTALANWIHKNSKRKEKPFISINCAAIPETLLESELYGYRKGAFSGASESRPGKFKAADGGTIFLDEVGEMSMNLQAKLLHVIEEKRYMKIGSHEYEEVDVRIIAATNKNIQQLVKNGDFREDLYYRLNLAEVEIPPIRDRKEDIPFLLEHALAKLNQKYSKQISLSEEAIELITSFSWPGNIRQMYNMLERIHIVSDTDMIRREDIEEVAYIEEDTNDVENDFNNIDEFIFKDSDLKGTLDYVEEKMILQALEETSGNQTKAAENLGISRHALIYKVKKIESK